MLVSVWFLGRKKVEGRGKGVVAIEGEAIEEDRRRSVWLEEVAGTGASDLEAERQEEAARRGVGSDIFHQQSLAGKLVVRLWIGNVKCRGKKGSRLQVVDFLTADGPSVLQIEDKRNVEGGI